MIRPTLLALALLLSPVLQAAPSTLRVGEAADGNLGPGRAEATYTLEATAGSTVTITLTSEVFDTYLVLNGPDGSELASDDDSGGDLNSRIGPYTLPEDGSYTLIARSLGGTGSFRIAVSEARIEALDLPGTVVGELTSEQPARIFRFRGEAGEQISIDLGSVDFDATLALAAGTSTGAPFASDDDSGGNLDARIGPLTLPESGDYFVTASSYGASAGAFTLRAERIDLRPIEFGSWSSFDFTASDQVAWFAIDADDELFMSAVVESNGSIDTKLRLLDPAQGELASNDDGGSGMDPELTAARLPRPGRYTLELRPFAPGEVGSVRLRVDRSTIASLDDGPQRVSAGPKSTLNMLGFDAEAGERVSIRVEESQGRDVDPVVVVSQSGTEIARAESTGVSAVTLEFTVDQGGTTYVRVDEGSGRAAVFEVSRKP